MSIITLPNGVRLRILTILSCPMCVPLWNRHAQDELRWFISKAEKWFLRDLFISKGIGGVWRSDNGGGADGGGGIGDRGGFGDEGGSGDGGWGGDERRDDDAEPWNEVEGSDGGGLLLPSMIDLSSPPICTALASLFTVK